MNFQTFDSRDRRNFLNHSLSFGPMHYTIANYSTQVKMTKKSDLESFDEEILSKISSIPDPLKKNLADTVLTNNKGAKMTSDDKEFFYSAMPEEKEVPTSRTDFYPSISNITSFFSNVFGAISGAVFHRRPKSPVAQYHDCFDTVIDHEMASDWHGANINDQNKNKAPDSASTELNDNMNNCKSAADHCEDKLNAVRDLLKNKPVARTPKTRLRRPRRAFVEPSSVEDSYEEDFISDRYVSLSNEEYIQYFARPNNQNQVYSEIDAPKMKVELIPAENTDIVKVLPEVTAKSEPVILPPEALPDRKEIISSCEEKMAKLKSLLLEKRKRAVQNDLYDSTDSVMEPIKEKPPKKPTKVIPIDKKQDKRFKNPHRLAEKRTRSRMLKNIQDDMVFANEVDPEDISSVNNSPILTPVVERVPSSPMAGSIESVDYFDELKGKFHSQSTSDSDDSFQIVFTDSPKQSRMWRPSECDSEDSFIVFEDSPDSCYTSNDVFGEESEIEDETESDSELSDSGCAFEVCKLTHNLSRTVSDLTDDSLYEDTQIAKPIEIDTIMEKFEDLSETTIDDCSATTTIDESLECCATADDEVDCAVRTFDVIPQRDIDSANSDVLPGLLIDDKKKCLRKNLPSKKVTFSEKPPKVHVMRVWTFAARQARAGHWERHALDRERFKRRIADVDMAVAWVLKPQHRSRVMFQRFMPWWNQLKRKEAAEKKSREEEAKCLAEEERKRIEETKRIEVENTKGIEVEHTKGIELEDKKTIEAGDEEKKILKENAKQLQTSASKQKEEQEVIEKVNTVAKDNTNNEKQNTKVAVEDVGIENSKVVTELFKEESDEKLKLNAASKDVDSKRVGTGNEKLDGVVKVNKVTSVESGRRKSDKGEGGVETKNVNLSKGNGAEIVEEKLGNEAIVEKNWSDKNRNTMEPNSLKFEKHKTEDVVRGEKVKEIEQVTEKFSPFGNRTDNSNLNKNLELSNDGNQLVDGKCKNVEISTNSS